MMTTGYNNNHIVGLKKFIMICFLRILLGVMTAALLCTPVQATLVQPPDVMNTAYLVADIQSEQILASKGVDEQIEPAALTKLMTAYLVFQALSSGDLNENQLVTLSDRGWQQPGSRMFLNRNQPERVKTILQGMLVSLGNDAAMTLAEAVAVDEHKFVQKMNHEAKILGMNHTNFVNCTGISVPDQYTTVGDLLILTQALIRNFPQYQSLFAQHSFNYADLVQINRNTMLFQDPSVDGMAVGYSIGGGYSLVVSSRRQQRHVVVIIAGAESEEIRTTQASALLNWALQNFDTIKIYGKQQVLYSLPVHQGQQSSVPIGFLQATYVTVPHGRIVPLRPILETTQPITAPIAKGDRVGTLRLFQGKQLVAEKPVQALADVGESGWLSRLWFQWQEKWSHVFS